MIWFLELKQDFLVAITDQSIQLSHASTAESLPSMENIVGSCPSCIMVSALFKLPIHIVQCRIDHETKCF